MKGEIAKKTIARKSSRLERILAGIGVVGVTGLITVTAFYNPVTAGFFPQCPLHSLTGLNCPGCGLTRGFHALFQGDILTALHFNALLPIYALIFGYLFLSLILVIVRGRGLPLSGFPPYLLWIFLSLTVIFGVVRNLPFYPFSLLAI